MGFDIGLKAFFQNPEVIAKSIVESQSQLLSDRSRLSPNEETRSLVQELRGQGFKDPEIYRALQARGIINA